MCPIAEEGKEKNMKKRILSVLLALSLILALSGCRIVIKGNGAGNSGGTSGGSSGGSGTGDVGGNEGGEDGGNEGGGEVDEPTLEFESAGLSGVLTGIRGEYTLLVTIDDTSDVSGFAKQQLGDDVSYSSDCEAIATVSADGVVTPHKYGATTVRATNGEGDELLLDVIVEFKVYSDGGYAIVTDEKITEAYRPTSEYEANRILDLAIINHVSKLTIDFSGISEGFTVDDFELDSELGGHTSFKTSYYPSSPSVVTFEIVYRADAASTTSGVANTNQLYLVPNGNALVRDHFDTAAKRADDFDGFKINQRTETLAVYNSEELWWAIEHGYKPVFPEQNSKAELFYERAKLILRNIVNDQMSDYEKLVAIYEYLVQYVAYDYDAYESGAGKSDTCYYLEGVFESGRAVCDGKTKALVLMLGIEGIECLRDFGSSKSGGAGHAWNYVKLDGVWYLVDTTEGDQRQNLYTGSGMAQFYNGSFEITSYAPLCLALDSHGDKYNYGEIWKDIFVGGNYADISDAYFDFELNESYDFILGSKAEAEALIAAAVEELGDKYLAFVLTVRLEGAEQLIHSYLDRADDFGLEKAIYTMDYDGEKVYIILFKEAVSR